MIEAEGNISGLEQFEKYTPYDLLYNGINLAERIGSSGQRLIIPRTFLFGTQELSEYSNAKREQVLAEFKRHGKTYMRKNPVIVLHSNFENGTQLIIVDGHHRVRYAPKYRITDIPCLVVSAETLTAIINEEKNTNITPAQFSAEMQQNAANALNSFDKRITDYRSPQFVFGVTKAADLNKRFASF